MKQAFATSTGTVEITLDEQSRILSAYRLGDDGRPAAAAIESWDHTDLAGVLFRQIGIPASEAHGIADEVAEWGAGMGPARVPADWRSLPHAKDELRGPFEPAGLVLRFVALLLDAIIVFLPMSFVIGLLSGGGYAERGPGYANAGINVEGKAFLLLLVFGLCYYIFFESLSGATLGKRMVGIRVIGEDGTELGLGAAVVRNLLRLVDGLFFYLVGALFALASPRRQRLGDRAAGSIVIRL
jgi:uncharacterized RDD family membrane protein YckC